MSAKIAAWVSHGWGRADVAPRRQHSVDARQGELLAWEPPDVVERYESHRVMPANWRDRIARAVSETLADVEAPRELVAERMSGYLSEEVSKAMLDAYASQAKEHTISFVRLVGLIEATGDIRLLQMVAEEFGFAVIEERYLGAVEEAILTAKEEELANRKKLARRRWKGGRR